MLWNLLLLYAINIAKIDDNLFVIADTKNHVIRNLTYTNKEWIVGTISGGIQGHLDSSLHKSRFSSPRGICTQNNVIYVTDEDNNVIRYISLQENFVKTLHFKNITFNHPNGIDIKEDLIYTSDANFLYRLNLITNTGEIMIECKSSPILLLEKNIIMVASRIYYLNNNTISKPSLSEDENIQGICTIKDDIVFSNYRNSCIHFTNMTLGDCKTPGNRDGVSPLFSYPRGIATWYNNIIVIDASNSLIRMINYETKFVSTLSGAGCDYIDGYAANARFCFSMGPQNTKKQRAIAIHGMSRSGNHWLADSLSIDFSRPSEIFVNNINKDWNFYKSNLETHFENFTEENKIPAYIWLRSQGLERKEILPKYRTFCVLHNVQIILLVRRNCLEHFVSFTHEHIGLYSSNAVSPNFDRIQIIESQVKKFCMDRNKYYNEMIQRLYDPIVIAYEDLNENKISKIAETLGINYHKSSSIKVHSRSIGNYIYGDHNFTQFDYMTW